MSRPQKPSLTALLTLVLSTQPPPEGRREGELRVRDWPLAEWLRGIRQAALAALDLSFLVYTIGIRPLRILISDGGQMGGSLGAKVKR